MVLFCEEIILFISMIQDNLGYLKLFDRSENLPSYKNSPLKNIQ